MGWTEQLHMRQPYLGAPELADGWSRVAEAMGGLADDDCAPFRPDAPTGLLSELDDHDRVHEAMGGMYAADEL
jgi:hypothetical protein